MRQAVRPRAVPDRLCSNGDGRAPNGLLTMMPG